MYTETQQWQAVVERTVQDNFVYGVISTGVVCRTGCPSRRPKRDNVRYFASISDAVQAGYRPCKRCIKEDSYQRVARICRDIDKNDEQSLTEIADGYGISLRQMQRLFRDVLGITPKQYEIQLRFQKFLRLLKAGLPVTDAVYEAGFRSSSRMYEQLSGRTGMTPSGYRTGGKGELILFAQQSTQVGEIILAQTLRGLCFAGFFDDRTQAERALCAEFPEAQRVEVGAAQIEPMATAFKQAIEGDYSRLRQLPLDIQGTAFQSQVWEAVRRVPVGVRVTYQELAAAMDKPKHARAVARALSGNRIALAVPCHRVVPGGKRSSGGYRWGSARKQQLLDNETNR